MAKIKIQRDSGLMDCETVLVIDDINKDSVLTVNAEMVDDMNQVWSMASKYDHSGDLLEINIGDLIVPMKFKKVSPKNIFKYLSTNFYNFLTSKYNGKNTCNYRFVKFSNTDYTINLTVSEDGTIIFKDNIKYFFKINECSEEFIKEPFNGKYYCVDSIEERPGIIVLGGSSSGFAWSEQIAAVLGSHGYNTLAISYFDYKGTGSIPKTLENIPLEYFKDGIIWLKGRKEVNSSSIGVVGISKGAEAALLIGSYYPDDIKAIVAYVPPAYVYEGVYLGRQRHSSSWTFGGEPLSFLPYPEGTTLSMFMKHGYLKEIHDQAIDSLNEELKEKARIKVEKIDASILLISSNMDNTWSSAQMCEMILEKMENKNITYLNYPSAGHIFMLPNLPPIIENENMTVADSYYANKDSWKRVKDFLNEKL